MRRKPSFTRKDREIRRKDGTSVHISRREEIKNRKLRKKGMIK